MDRDTARLDLGRLAELRELDLLGVPGAAPCYVDQVIGRFLVKARELLAAMEDAILCNDLAQLRALAYRLSGSAFNMGAVAVGEAAQAVEEHAIDGDLDDAAAAISGLVEELAADVGALRAYQREHAANQPHPSGRA